MTSSLPKIAAPKHQTPLPPKFSEFRAKVEILFVQNIGPLLEEDTEKQERNELVLVTGRFCFLATAIR